MRMRFGFDVWVEQDVAVNEDGITEEELFNHLYKLKDQKKFKGIKITCMDKD